MSKKRSSRRPDADSPRTRVSASPSPLAASPGQSPSPGQLEILRRELAETRVRLAEAQETLQAIRQGEVDALVVEDAHGEKVFTLQGAETTYRFLVEEMSEGALLLGTDGTILYANDRFAGLVQAPLERVVGRLWQEFFFPGERGRLAELVAAASTRAKWQELQLRSVAGGSKPVGVSICSMKQEQVEGFSVVVTDLSQRKAAEAELRKANESLEARVRERTAQLMEELAEREQVEEALRRSEAQLAQGVRVAQLGTFEHDHVTDAIEVSPLLREMWGLGPAEPVTLSGVVEHVAEEDRERVGAAIRQAHDPGGDGMYHTDHRVISAGKGIRWVSVRSQTFFEGEGAARRAVRTIGAVLDITQRKVSEAELERLVAERTAKLQDLVGELEHFSYSITHDLKSPLRAMKGFAEIALALCGDCARAEAKEAMARISTSADRMESLITDALNYGRAVRQELPLTDVDAGTLLRGMLDSYPEFQPSRAHIQVEGRLPVVLGNEAGLTQCFSNLLGNAVKFVRPGEKPLVRVWAEEREEWVRIWVEDKGIGISKEMLPRVFEMFSRGGGGYEGTGVGLALVRKVIQRMGGRVDVESEEGKGSRFWIELKLGEARARPARVEAVAAEPKSGTVLYVEDEENDALFMKMAFAAKGLESALRVVGDGRAAIEYLSGAGEYAHRKKYPLPAVVLLDLNLPQVPGFEVLRWMRNHPDFARTPVVVFSSSTREDDRVKARELGANEFVPKPSSGLEFGQVVEGLSGKWMALTPTGKARRQRSGVS